MESFINEESSSKWGSLLDYHMEHCRLFNTIESIVVFESHNYEGKRSTRFNLIFDRNFRLYRDANSLRLKFQALHSNPSLNHLLLDLNGFRFKWFVNLIKPFESGCRLDTTVESAVHRWSTCWFKRYIRNLRSSKAFGGSYCFGAILADLPLNAHRMVSR